MSEVLFMAHQTAWLIGWIFIGVLLAAAYVKIGLWVCRSVQILNVASPQVRLAAAIMWPLVAIGRLLAWSMKISVQLMARLYVVAIEAATGDVIVPAAPSTDQKPSPGPYRSEETDGQKLTRLYAERQGIDRQIKEINDRLAHKSQPKALTN